MHNDLRNVTGGPQRAEIHTPANAARKAWIEEADDDPKERRRREKDRDFLAYEDSDGRFLDFHALRVTFGTSLARAGVRLQMAQRLMRHSTPVLTANVYTKLELHDLRGAVERLGGATSSRPGSAPASVVSPLPP